LTYGVAQQKKGLHEYCTQEFSIKIYFHFYINFFLSYFIIHINVTYKHTKNKFLRKCFYDVEIKSEAKHRILNSIQSIQKIHKRRKLGQQT
jgi:hypothetical protein